MFSPVNRRIVRPLVYILAAAQLLLSAPIVTATTLPATNSATEMPCAASMPMVNDSKSCPCCPDGTKGMAACLSACTAAVAALPTLSIHVSRNATMPVITSAIVYRAEQADPPLKPPPIV